MAKLTYGQRKRLPKSDFVFPKTRKFPLPDANHGRDALARAANKSPSVKAAVRAKVHAKFPGIKIGGAKSRTGKTRSYTGP